MTEAIDPIPLEDEYRLQGPDATGQYNAMFYAFNTVVTLQAFADESLCKQTFRQALDACRKFERLFSRTLPHSDIARLNDAHGSWVDVSRETFDLLATSKRYCEESGGIFDITMGSAVKLWDFHRGIIPDAAELEEALRHVDWRGVVLEQELSQEGAAENLQNGHAETQDKRAEPQADESEKNVRYRARLDDPHASVDVGGTAKGYIADAVGAVLLSAGIERFIVNLGGNVLAHGAKPDGKPWRIGLQDPRASRESGKIVGAVPLTNASAVTSGTYERCFAHDGRTYHHILDPKTGFPAETDLAGATVVARTSLDAEGYSTTLLALGKDAAAEFVRTHESILAAYLIDAEGRMSVISRG